MNAASSAIRYHRPADAAAASALLAENAGALVVAGGTDLIVKWKNGILPGLTDLVDLGALNLNRISVEGGKLRIGSSCTMEQIRKNPLVQERFPTLASAVGQIGALQIRHAATLGGNVANASPAGDSIPALMTLDASVVLSGPNGRRNIAIGDFFTGPGKTVMQKGELIEAFELPDRVTKGCFLKLGERLAHAISKVSLALTTWQTDGGKRTVRIAMGAVAPKVIRATVAEQLLESQAWPPTSELLDKAAQAASDGATPIDDIRSVKGYRKKMAGVLLAKAVHRIE